MNVVFSNPGEIDPRLITTLGVNVKESKSPIGYFGTGLKYAIAICLCHGCEVTIYSGLDKHKFSIERDTVRGKEFGFICMHTTRQGIHAEPIHRLGFTTDLGKNWTLWMAYREFYCNAKDEGGSVSSLGDTLPSSGSTHIIVSGSDFLKAHHERSSWLLSVSPTWTLPSLEINHKQGTAVFYKSIKILDLPKPSLFTYNILSELRLTEDRTANSWDVAHAIRSALSTEYTHEQDMLKAILTARDGSYERDFDWSFAYFNDEAKDLIEKLWTERNAFLSRSAVVSCSSRFQKRPLESLKLTNVQTQMLAKAKAFLAAFGYPITQEIFIVETLGDHWTLGQAKDGEIFLARSVFDKGTKYLCSTLLEEHLHITHGFNDCSRELQDWLFDKVISLAEEAQGKPL